MFVFFVFFYRKVISLFGCINLYISHSSECEKICIWSFPGRKFIILDDITSFHGFIIFTIFFIQRFKMEVDLNKHQP